MAWWMAAPVVMQAASAVTGAVGGWLSGDQMRKETSEQIRRMQKEHEQQLSSTLAIGLGSGVETGSESLQKYISDMSAEMLRQRQWTRRAGNRSASAAQLSSIFQGAAGLTSAFDSYARMNNYWKK